MSEKIEISGYTQDGRPVIEMPKREYYGGGALSDPAFKVQRAIGELRKGGYAVPGKLATWVDNVGVAKRIPAAPVPPSATDPDFAGKLEQYVADRAAHEVRVAAVADVVTAAKGEMSDLVRAAAAEVLADKKLRKDFEEAAKEYRSAALALRGVETIQAAANADLDGSTVAAWHRRTEAGKRLSGIVDMLKRFLDVLAPLGWDTLQILAMVTEHPTQGIANTVKGQTHVPEVCRRWEALFAADRPFKLMGSLREYSDRLQAASDRLEVVA